MTAEDPQDVLRAELAELRQEHRELDERIGAIQSDGLGDRLSLQRMKKRKLALKDRIAVIEDQLYPDIIA